MRALVYFVMMLLVGLLTGCQTNPPAEPEPQIQYKTVLVTPPDALLRSCRISPPPNKAAFLAADSETKERMLSESLFAQNENLSACNTDKANLRVWKSKQQAIYQ